MQKLSKTSIIKYISLFLSLLLIAKLTALITWYILPDKGVEVSQNSASAMEYQRVDFANMIGTKKVTRTMSNNRENSIRSDISDLILSGLYGTKKEGFAIVAKKRTPMKTKIISVGESYEGYKLKEIHLNYVVFEKNSRSYILKLNRKKSQQGKSTIQVEEAQEIGKKRVSRDDINHYAKNFRDIWKDISIIPLKKSGKIEGFKVTRIRKNSKMAELGLKKGDIILKVNNIKLSSFNDAIKIYKNIDKIDTIELVVLRNNQEKDIVYEIN